jgi:hypothetical protein
MSSSIYEEYRYFQMKNILSQAKKQLAEKEDKVVSITEEIYEFVRIWNEENNIMNGDELTELQDSHLQESIRPVMNQKDTILSEINLLYTRISEITSLLNYMTPPSNSDEGECLNESDDIQQNSYEYGINQDVLDMLDYESESHHLLINT